MDKRKVKMVTQKLIEFLTPGGAKFCLSVFHISGISTSKDGSVQVHVGDDSWGVNGSYDEVKYYLQLQHIEIWELPKSQSET